MKRRQTKAIDRQGLTVTYARACSASREYVLARVPIAIIGGKIIEDHSSLSAADKRFVLEDITPREYAVLTGEAPLEKIDRSR